MPLPLASTPPVGIQGRPGHSAAAAADAWMHPHRGLSVSMRLAMLTVSLGGRRGQVRADRREGERRQIQEGVLQAEVLMQVNSVAVRCSGGALQVAGHSKCWWSSGGAKWGCTAVAGHSKWWCTATCSAGGQVVVHRMSTPCGSQS